MKRATADYIRHVLDLHTQYSRDPSRPRKERETEKAYLQGMYWMLEVIATEGYTISGKSINDFLDEAREE